MANQQNGTGNHSLVAPSDSKITTVKIVWFSVFTLESLLILILNSVALSIFFKKKFLVKKSTYLLINLTFADLLVGLTIPVIFAVDFVKNPYLKLGFYLPPLLAAFESLLSLTAIAVERVFAIFRPFRHRLLNRSHYIWCITITWLTAAIISFFLVGEVFNYHWWNGFDSHVLNYCQIIFTLSLTFIIVSSYIAIWIKVTFYKRFNTQRNDENKKMAKTLFIVALIFLVTWWPMNIFERFDDGGSYMSLEYGMYCLVYSNSFFNCIVYSVRMPEFRRELIIVLHKLKKVLCLFGPIEPTNVTNAVVIGIQSSQETMPPQVELKSIRQKSANEPI